MGNACGRIPKQMKLVRSHNANNANENRYRFQLCNLITQNSTKFLYSDPETRRSSVTFRKLFLLSAANELENLIAPMFQ